MEWEVRRVVEVGQEGARIGLWEEAKAIGAAEDLVGEITNFELVLGEEPW